MLGAHVAESSQDYHGIRDSVYLLENKIVSVKAKIAQWMVRGRVLVVQPRESSTHTHVLPLPCCTGAGPPIPASTWSIPQFSSPHAAQLPPYAPSFLLTSSLRYGQP